MNDLAHFLWVSAGSMAILYAIYFFFLKKETFFTLNRVYLLLSVAFSMIIPWAGFRGFSISEDGPSGAIVLLDTLQVGLQNFDNGIQNTVVEKIRPAVYLYLAGAGLFTLKFIWQTAVAFRLIASEKYKPYCYNGTHCRLVFTSGVNSPFSIFSYIILPENLKGSAGLNDILSHEISHIRKGHTFDLIFLELTGIVHWFNPMMWLYKTSLKDTHEYQADRQVLSEGTGLTGYQKLLLEQITGTRYGSLANNFNQSIKKRITMMKRTRSTTKAMVKAALLLPLILLVPFFISCSSAQEDQKDMESTVEKGMKDLQSETVAAEVNNAATEANADDAAKEAVYDAVPVMPQFPGGEQARLRYFAENIKYPQKAKTNGTQGTVFVSFVVGKDGSISDIELVRGIGDGCDEETIRVVSEMPKWVPGKNDDGEVVKVKFALPVKFKLG
ncbi:MAG: M56 family metallopeptidase [Bacteroidales bacterium]|nr:M56 family metallopeptidase [Bacteroidales bacterium]